MRVLIAEDDNVMRRILEVSLPKWGHECISASDGVEAWRIFQEQEFDLVVTDWMMPGMNGIELCQKIKATAAKRYTYVIILTSLDSKDHLAHGIEEGADDYIEKPFEPSELKARLKAGQRIVDLERTLAASNKKMKDELVKAATTIDGLLPLQNRKINNISVHWHFQPWVYVGGDLFNVFKLDDDNSAFYMLDVSGHGISAALLAVSLSHLLRPHRELGGILKTVDENGNETIVQPAQIAKSLNKRFQMDQETEMYFSFIYGIVNHPKMEMRWIRAGHPRPFLMRKDQAEILVNDNPPIGLIEEAEFTDSVEKLERGDKIAIYSDGIIEASNKDGQQFGMEGLQKSIQSQGTFPAKLVMENILNNFEDFRGRTEQEDDISLLLLGIE